MAIHQLENIDSYVHFLQRYPNELDILFKELLIGVTNFFRDLAVWKMLKEKILPDLFNELPNGHVLRVWSAGCSTGEEAYSFAIVFKEAYSKVKHNKNMTLQVFASDIDKHAIEIARKGIFTSNIITLDDKIEGLVITFIDITVAKKLEAKLATANIEEKEKWLAELAIASKELTFQNKNKQKLADELTLTNKKLEFQNKEKQKLAHELVIANKELALQKEEERRLAAELNRVTEILEKHNLYKP